MVTAHDGREKRLRGAFSFWILDLNQEAAMASKKPSKADLSKAGKELRNPRTPEKRETKAAKILQKGRKKPS